MAKLHEDYWVFRQAVVSVSVVLSVSEASLALVCYFLPCFRWGRVTNVNKRTQFTFPEHYNWSCNKDGRSISDPIPLVHVYLCYSNCAVCIGILQLIICATHNLSSCMKERGCPHCQIHQHFA